MQLARMQDIGGLRTVVDTPVQVRKLQALYTNGNLTHELIGIDDYIARPKASGYRSVLLIYRYKNPSAELFNGLILELQIRTRLQHAWATAVETIGSFLNHALKASERPEEWLEFFKIAGAAFAIIERCPVAEEFAHQSAEEIWKECIAQADRLDVRNKLDALAVAANSITSDRAGGSYHLIILDAKERTVAVASFGKRRLDEANAAYAAAELRAQQADGQQVVLVATDSIESLRRAYPNYFLDTKQFLNAIRRIERLIKISAAKQKIEIE